MSAISSKLRKWVDPESGNEGLTFWCQGCESAHGIRIKGPGSWGWNGDVDKPVFSPSVLTTGGGANNVCHTFVGCNGAQAGEVIFLGDCSHGMAGTVQPFPDLPDWLKG